jgi:hypothetical protein
VIAGVLWTFVAGGGFGVALVGLGVDRLESLARSRGRWIISTSREWLHRVVCGPSQERASAAR